MKRTAIFSMPFTPDSSLNAWGDYTHLVHIVTDGDDTASYVESWWLRPKLGTGVPARSLTTDEVRQALDAVFRQNAIREFPPPARKSWWQRFREWLP